MKVQVSTADGQAWRDLNQQADRAWHTPHRTAASQGRTTLCSFSCAPYSKGGFAASEPHSPPGQRVGSDLPVFLGKPTFLAPIS